MFKLTLKIPERRQWHRSGVLIDNFEPFPRVSIGHFQQVMLAGCVPLLMIES